MVCDAATLLGTAASLMMNGVCCMYQMQEEEDRREAIRKDIRVEYERQRLAERDQQRQSDRQFHSDSSILIEERRKSLLRRKHGLSSENLHQQQREAGNEDRDGATSTLMGCSSFESSQAIFGIAVATVKSPASATVQSGNASYKIYPKNRSSPQSRKGARSSPRDTISRTSKALGASDMSSLFDFDGVEEADERSSLVEVSLL